LKIAIIPARGGSKRVPRKNIREFAGKPLIAYPISTALRSGLFDKVIVSTDDHEIADVSRHFGAEVPFLRPPELADDFTGTIAVIAHAVAWSKREWSSDISAVCCIYPTAPFICIEDLKTGLVLLESGKWQYVFSATTFASQIFRAFRNNAEDGLDMFFPDQFDVRSQDLPEALHDAGQFYWGTPNAWLSGKKIFGEHSSIVLLPHWRVQDIDTEEDWRHAEYIATFASISENSRST